MSIDEYARAVARAALRWALPLPVPPDQIDAIIASVPAPDVQAQIDAAVHAYRKDMHECEQIAGRFDADGPRLAYCASASSTRDFTRPSAAG